MIKKIRQYRIIGNTNDGLPVLDLSSENNDDTGDLPIINLKKKSGGEPSVQDGKKQENGGPTPSQSPSPSPSKSPLTEDQRKKFEEQNAKFPVFGQQGVLSDRLYRPKSVTQTEPYYEIQQKKEAEQTAELLKAPTVENIKKAAEKGLQRKAAETAVVVDKTTDSRKISEIIKPLDVNAVKQQLTDDFNKKFVSGDLSPEDMDVLKAGNPLLNKAGTLYIDNNQLAKDINTKTTNLIDFARSKNIDGNTYYFTNKDIEQNISSLRNRLYNAQSASDDKIYVDATATKLPNQGGGVVNGMILVDRNAYVRELSDQLNDAKNKEFFLKNDFSKNRYDPVAEKQTQVLIENITKSGELDLGKFGTGISQEEDLYIKKKVDEYLRQLNDPVINAAQGVTEKPVNQREYLDIYNRVRNYFNEVVPVKGWVENNMNHFFDAPANKKFKPLVDNIKSINDYFNSDENQKFESVLNATTDANQAAIYSKYNKEFSKNPTFVEIVNRYAEKVKNEQITEEEANIEIAKEVRNVAALQPLIKQQDNEIKATILEATKQREQRLINSVATLPDNIIFYDDGTIGLKGVSKAESKKFFDKYAKTYEESMKLGAEAVASDRQKNADEIFNSYKNKYGGFLTSGAFGLAQGWGNMMEASTRWMSNSFGVADDMRDYYTTGNKAMGETTQNSEFAQKHFKYNGLRSLLDPRYYAYNVGQSAPYMAPGMAATIVTGGGAAGAITGGVIGSTIETAQNGLQTYNELLTTGKDEFGLPMTEYKASQAMADQMRNEIVPNLILQSLEFGTIFRGSKLEKPRLNLLGGAADVAKSGGMEGLQEAIQGRIQYNTKEKALGNEEMDLWDYMQSDDFRQNFFGGLAGGIGFGTAGKMTQLAGRNKKVKEWNRLVNLGNMEFAQNSLYGYATESEMNGQGAQFRDALRLRLQNNQFKDENEKNGLMQMLAYSSKLADATKSLGVASGNINGMAAAHNLALADMYNDYAKTGNKESSLSEIYKQRSNEYKTQAQEILKGNTSKVHYVLNNDGTPIFLSENTAQALGEEGVLNDLYQKGEISGASGNIELQERKLQTPTEEAVVEEETTTEEVAPEQATTPEQVEADLKTQLGEEKSTQVSKEVSEFVDNELLPEELPQAEKDEAKKNPLGFLKAVADQAQTPLVFEGKTIDTRERTVSKYGEEVVKLAEETFPKVEATPESKEEVSDVKGNEGWDKDVESTEDAIWGIKGKTNESWVETFGSVKGSTILDIVSEKIDWINDPQKNGFKDIVGEKGYNRMLDDGSLKSENEKYIRNNKEKIISEAYHKAKADGSNPELVKAVEDLLGKPTESKSEPITPQAEEPISPKMVTYENITKKTDKELLDRLKELTTSISNDNSKGRFGSIVNIKEAEKITKHLTKKYGIESVLEDLGLFDKYGEFDHNELKIRINRSTTLDKDGNYTAATKPTGNISRRVIFHEYLHPFVDVLKDSNSELYEEIYKSAERENEKSKFADVSHYDNRLKKDELIVRYLDRLSDSDKVPSLFQRFIDFISEFFYKNRKNDAVTLKRLSKNTTVEELYDVFKNYGNLKQDFTNAEARNKVRREIGFWEEAIRVNEGKGFDAEFVKKIRQQIKYLQDSLKSLNYDKKSEIDLIKEELKKRGISIPTEEPTRTQEQPEGKPKINEESVGIFEDISKADKSKISKKEKTNAINKAIEKYGDKGKRAAFIHDNFDDIVKQLKETKKLEVICK